jgi:hypothetical protein
MSAEKQTLWEYRVVWMELRIVNIYDVDNLVASIDKELNSWGSKGWELVFVHELGAGKVSPRAAYIFKRPKPQNAA